ncbi:MAG: transferrin receptor-like dimerization domain-containing protein [Bacteroidia bacterium]
MRYLTLTSFFALMLAFDMQLLAQNSFIMGFSPSAAETQIQLETEFDQLLKASNLDQWMKRLAARPHHVGSPYDKENAEFMAALFTSWGYETAIEEYQVLFPTPKVRQLELVAPTTFKARLAEPAIAEDATSGQTKEQLPSYNCYSIDGDVTAELVFVNYGVPADYDELAKMGVDVRGKIVIARYQGSWRGIKPKVAAEKGAIGCIIYSDPRDDGYFRGEVYPQGAYKNEYGVQRGSVMDAPVAPGDPLTPGIGATPNAKRLDIKSAPTLTKIPVIPISYGDAKPLLAAMGGQVAPEAWRGALPITYHVGPGPAKVHLKLEFDWQIKPIYNVIAKLTGAEYPDQWIIRGNHHDAWVNGASDPVSGMVAELEEARVVGELAKKGFRPKRTIVYCAWDAEEPGLIGSTEWVEDHTAELLEKAVVYINSDGNGRGFLHAGGSHTLEKFFDQIPRTVTDPQTKVSLFDRNKARDLVQGKPEPQIFQLGALGTGSDYSPFIQHLGIAALDLGFGGENGGGEYHSIYDSYDHFVRFKDPGFQYGITLSKVAGRATLRLANAESLPFEFQRFSTTISGYLDEVMKLADDMREKTKKENRLIREGLYQLAADPTQPLVVPEPREDVPFMSFAPLQNLLEKLKKQSVEYEKAIAENKLNAGTAQQLNIQLKNMERALTSSNGLPGRPWYRHHIYAPGLYTGYSVKTLPGVREAIEQRDWPELDRQIQKLTDVLETFSIELEKAIGLAGSQGKN